MDLFFSALIGYFIGNILSAYILGVFIHKVDIRQHGSKNPGSTNAVRLFGLKTGFIAFIFDFLKSFLACYLGFLLAGRHGMLTAGIFCVLGHDWPIFFKFKGGKGIACSAGMICFVYYKIFVCILCLFVIIFAVTKIVSLASIISSIFTGILGFIWLPDNFSKITFLLLSLLALIRHKENIKRLFKGEEKQLKISKER